MAESVEGSDLAWRLAMLADVNGGNVDRATDALLALTFNDPDRLWLEVLLLDLIDNASDSQVQALAVICLGHVARIHRSISEVTVMPKLQELLSDDSLRSRARNALEDIEDFT